MIIRHCIKMSVQEQVFFDTVCHALAWDTETRRVIMQEADMAGRQFCTDPDVRAIFQCMDLGLSPRECYHFLSGQKPTPKSFLHWFI